jgi:hypothetical protein
MGLDNWYTEIFEKTGWMILAKSRELLINRILYKFAKPNINID